MKNLDFYVKLGATIRKQRIRQSVTLKEISKSLDVSVQQLNKYELGTNRIPIDRFGEICRILGVSCDWLLNDVINS